MIRAARLLLLAVLFYSPSLYANVVISEIACTTQGDDWVELYCSGTGRVSIDISKFFVTMYYGTNEQLSSDPVTLYSYDKPETPYDDRYAVVHLTAPGTADETDFTGDTNRNGRIDIYCSQYAGSLWNAECVISIDDNDDPDDGMIDFAAWSDCDGTPSDTILSYCEAALKSGQWKGESPVLQTMLIPVPKGGIASYQSISRRTTDSNGPEDFEITQFQTPGRENRFSGTASATKIFKLDSGTISVVPGHPNYPAVCSLQIFDSCDIRMRVFSDIGEQVFDSGLLSGVAPGMRSLTWDNAGSRRSGLYIAQLEASAAGGRKHQSKKFFFIITRYR